METTILQVPISKTLRDQAALAASNQGFSSLQEAVRVFLHKIANKSLNVTFEPKAIQLSPRAIKRYNKISDEIASGKAKLYSFDTTTGMFKFLNSK